MLMISIVEVRKTKDIETRLRRDSIYTSIDTPIQFIFSSCESFFIHAFSMLPFAI